MITSSKVQDNPWKNQVVETNKVNDLKESDSRKGDLFLYFFSLPAGFEPPFSRTNDRLVNPLDHLAALN
jgi:hypothetical protein